VSDSNLAEDIAALDELAAHGWLTWHRNTGGLVLVAPQCPPRNAETWRIYCGLSVRAQSVWRAIASLMAEAELERQARRN